MIDCVFDSSAILADIHGEPGGDLARASRGSACISAINASEVVAKLIEAGLSPDQAQDIFDQYGCEVVVADRERGMLSGRLHALTRRKGVSLGDRFCLALALELGLPVLTADRRWKSLDLDVEVVLIR